MSKKSHLTQGQLKEIKDMIISEIEKIKNRQSVNTLDTTEYDMKDAVDEANNNILIESTNRLSSRETYYLKKLYKAQKAILGGTYGHCEECDAEIPFSRLKARITSEMCIDCKEETENEESKSMSGRASKSYGKKIDIVKSL